MPQSVTTPSAPSIRPDQQSGGMLAPLPAFTFGAGVFSGAYNGIAEQTLYDTVRRALDRGVKMFDTAPYYGRSEEILGEALHRVAEQYPRCTYQLSTKVGRYGPKVVDFDFSADRVRASVAESCRRLHTDYLDLVICHDVEFVEDAQVLDQALPALFALKDDGVIGKVAISGYPLEVLLRIARKQAERGRPLDVVLSYCHYTLQSTRLAEAMDQFRAAGVREIMNASPLSMGLFRDADPPAWHPADMELRAAVRECAALCRDYGWLIADLALRYTLAFTAADSVVVGCCTPYEIDQALDSFCVARHSTEYTRPVGEAESMTAHKQHYDELLHKVLTRLAPYRDTSWASPPPDAY